MGSAGGCYYGVDTEIMTELVAQKSFSRKIAEGFAWSSGGAGVLKIIGFFVTFLIIARLSLSEYGTYQLTLAAWGLLMNFFASGVNQILIAKASVYAKQQEESRIVELGRGLFLSKCAIGFLLWLFVFFGTGFLKKFYSGDIVSLLRILSWTFLAIPFSEFIRFDLSLRLKFFALNLFDVIEEVIRATGVLLVLFVFHSGIPGLLWTIVLSILFTPFFFLFVVKKSYLNPAFPLKLQDFFRLIFGQGKWVILQKFVRQGEKNLRPFFIQYFIGREAVALFSVAEKLFMHLVTLIPMQSVLVPAVSSEVHDEDRSRRVFERGVKYSVPFYALIALVSFFAVPWLLVFLFPQYLSALPLFNIFLLYIPFVGVSYLLTSFFFSQHEQRAAFFIVLARFGVFLALAPLFLRLFGLTGIAAEYIISLYFNDILRYFSLVRHHPFLRVRMSVLFRVDDYDRALWSRIKKRVPTRNE